MLGLAIGHVIADMGDRNVPRVRTNALSEEFPGTCVDVGGMQLPACSTGLGNRLALPRIFFAVPTKRRRLSVALLGCSSWNTRAPDEFPMNGADTDTEQLRDGPHRHPHARECGHDLGTVLARHGYAEITEPCVDIIDQLEYPSAMKARPL